MSDNNNKNNNNKYNLRKRKNMDVEEKDDSKRFKSGVVNEEIWKSLNQLFRGNGDDNKNWVSASSTKNHLLNDSLIDWLDLYYNGSGKEITVATHEKNSHDYKNTLFEMGNKFENTVFSHFTKYHTADVKMVCANRSDFGNKNNCKITEDYMKNGVPIIQQAMLVNDTNKTFGVADLLIRSDYINKILRCKVLTREEETTKAPFLNGNYHYIVIDIKWSTIPLRADETTILNQDRVVAYKGQIAIYNLAMGMVQGFIPNNAFIMGKSWKCDSKHSHSNNCFDKLGVISYTGIDKNIILSTHEAVNWIREVRNDGHEWDCYNPKRSELYPNMTSKNDSWSKVKKDIAVKVNELTQLYYVGYKNREAAHKQSVYGWDDAKCNSKVLNIKGVVIAPRVDAIIKVNRDMNSNIYYADGHKTKMGEVYNNDDQYVDFYIDFETINECLVDKNINLVNSFKNTNIIFMIGVGHGDAIEQSTNIGTDQFVFKTFTIDKLAKLSLEQGEKIILNQFCEYVNSVSKYETNINKKIRFYHWGNAEITFMKNANNRHDDLFGNFIKKITFVDMCSIFTSVPIVVKGALNFKLKQVANAMCRMGLIKTSWDSGQVADGFDAMLLAANYYAGSLDKNDNPKNELMDSIEKYNYVDCKVLWEIIGYLRNNIKK